MCIRDRSELAGRPGAGDREVMPAPAVQPICGDGAGLIIPAASPVPRRVVVCTAFTHAVSRVHVPPLPTVRVSAATGAIQPLDPLLAHGAPPVVAPGRNTMARAGRAARSRPAAAERREA